MILLPSQIFNVKETDSYNPSQMSTKGLASLLILKIIFSNQIRLNYKFSLQDGLLQLAYYFQQNTRSNINKKARKNLHNFNHHEKQCKSSWKPMLITMETNVDHYGHQKIKTYFKHSFIQKAL